MILHTTRKLLVAAGIAGATFMFVAPNDAEAQSGVTQLDKYDFQQQQRHGGAYGYGLDVPELDPSSGAAGLALLAGGVALVMRRRRED